ncbi:MAG: diguanylate cyclase [Gemmatimonadetes bacterium]|nr:diguanylate cyclase [Gemmatimonadota bacterium]
MRVRSILVFHSPKGRNPPALVTAFARETGLRLEELARADDVLARVNRSFPACIIMDAEGDSGCIELCRALKQDTFTAIVPVVLLSPENQAALVRGGLEAGADEVLTDAMEERERHLRLQMALHRADRDVSVNPTTRLAGTVQIERDIGERLRSRELFACCYADLDHFKEFNDRYGYNEGDRVILLLSRILRDVVKAYAPTGFIGHIGGDDFIFNLSLPQMRLCCEEIIEIFDELISFQYTQEDRQAGYFLGKDRRGNIYRTPIMTVSIGVVTNEHRHFTHTARVSELVTEMKSYAKTLPGSVYAVDRRRDAPLPALESSEPALEASAES